MAPSHDSGSHDDHEAHEDPLRTPGWLPLLGIGLLMAGALSVYLFVSPGVLAGPSGPEGADASADASPDETGGGGALRAPQPVNPH